MRLDDETFLRVIEATPLVSIDLIIRNAQGQVLLGKRVNRPAQGFWFVPGGRIRKNERVHQALQRISKEECGFVVDNPALIGVFDHIYHDNFAGREGINTQYVVIAYSWRAGPDVRFAPDSQHSELKWWTVEAVVGSSEVHPNTKAYFSS